MTLFTPIAMFLPYFQYAYFPIVLYYLHKSLMRRFKRIRIPVEVYRFEQVGPLTDRDHVLIGRVFKVAYVILMLKGLLVSFLFHQFVLFIIEN